MPGPLPRYRIYTRPKSYWVMLRDCLSGSSLCGDDLQRLEDKICERTGAAHAITMPQARVGIFLAIRALIRPGQEVICSPYTIHDVINMVICAGGIPVFVDIDRATCNIDPDQVKSLIHENTGAVLVTHLHGLAVDVQDLASHCRQNGIALIEDAAQAFGARVRGRHVGTLGDAGVFSFGMYKNLNSFYGGMVITDRKDLYDQLRDETSNHPPHPLSGLLKKTANALSTDLATYPPLFKQLTYRVFRYGYLNDVETLNKRVRVEDDPQIKQQVPEHYLCRMRATQARIVRMMLPKVDEDFAARMTFSQMYHEGLKDLDEVICPPFSEDGSHVYNYFPIQYRERESLVRYMMTHHCDVAVQHIKNCADLDCFRDYRRDCPRARDTANATILLPNYPRYDRFNVERNIRCIRAFFGQEASSQ